MYKTFALLVSHFQTSILALKSGGGNTQKPDGKTVRIFDAPLQWNQILLSYFPLESSVAVYGIDILRCVPQFLSIITISGVIVRPPLWCCSTSAAPHSKGVVAPH